MAGNPLILACAIGLAINLSPAAVRSRARFRRGAGRSSLAIGLLVIGAGLHFEGLFRPSLAAGVAGFLKLVLMPVMAMALAIAFGVTGTDLAVVTICASVPSASNGYVLARQMGGDAPLLAQIFMLQTIVAALTMPIAIALVA